MKAKAQIFLCYAQEDEEKVEDLYQHLSDAGFKPWMAKKDILPGEIWQLSIQQAIRRSDFIMVCLSVTSVSKRSFIQREIKDALDIWQEKLEDDIYLIPVRLEDCKVPESLCAFQWVNLFEKDGWTRLVKAIQVGVERRSEPLHPPLRLDKESQVVWIGTRKVELSDAPFFLLSYLYDRAGHIVSNHKLMTEVELSYDTLRQQVRRIRQEIEPNPKRPVYLVSVRGRGLRLDNVVKRN